MCGLCVRVRVSARYNLWIYFIIHFNNIHRHISLFSISHHQKWLNIIIRAIQIKSLVENRASLESELLQVESVKTRPHPLLWQEHAPTALWLVLLRYLAHYLNSYWSIWCSVKAQVPPWKSMKSERDLRRESHVKLEGGRKDGPGSEGTPASK